MLFTRRDRTKGEKPGAVRPGTNRGGLARRIDFRPVPPRKSERKGPFAHFVELVARKNCITRLQALSAPPPLIDSAILLLRIDYFSDDDMRGNQKKKKKEKRTRTLQYLQRMFIYKRSSPFSRFYLFDFSYEKRGKGGKACKSSSMTRRRGAAIGIDKFADKSRANCKVHVPFYSGGVVHASE